MRQYAAVAGGYHADAMAGTPDAPIVLTGEGRHVGEAGGNAAATVTLEADGFSFALGDAPPGRAAYRDVTTVAVQQGAALVALGEGADARRFLFERFGEGLGALVRELRDRRLRQRLADRLVELPDEPIELVEFASGTDSGVAQLACHDRGFVLAPLDERFGWRAFRRAEIGAVSPVPERGAVRVEPAATASHVGPREPIELLRLGHAAVRHAARFRELRDAAAADATRLIGVLMADVSYAQRDRLGTLLVDGRPIDRSGAGDAWAVVEGAVLAEPVFAASYRALVERGGGDAAPRWLALAPERPGADSWRGWFFVALPGNLVAMELVSPGAHATYCFRVVPRAEYGGSGPVPAEALAAAVGEISAALLDARFLREPIGLPDEQLADARYLRYRLALAALPTLAAARRRFVARLVHRDEKSWAGALDDLVRWHAAVRDEAAAWPGRAAQESEITEAGLPIDPEDS